MTVWPFALWPGFPDLPGWSSLHRLSGRRRRPNIRADLRPPPKPSVRISRTGLSQRCVTNTAPGSVRHGRTLRLLNGFSSHVSSDIDFWVFHKRNLSTAMSLLARQLLLPNHLCPPPSPAHVAAFMRSHRFHGASGTIRRSDYSPCIASHFAFPLIGLLILLPFRNATSPPGVTHRSSVPCRPHTPWYDGWMRTPSPP